MKYIRKYEDVKYEDFTKIKYWRWKSNLKDTIMKVEYENEFQIKFTFFDLNNSQINSQDWLNSSVLLHIIKKKRENPDFILRPATEEEIEKFEKMKEFITTTNKYNL